MIKNIYRYKPDIGDCVRLRACVDDTDFNKMMLGQLCYGVDVSHHKNQLIGTSPSLRPFQAALAAPFFKKLFEEINIEAELYFHILNLRTLDQKYRFIYDVTREAFGLINRRDSLTIPMTWKNAAFLIELERRMTRLEDIPIYENTEETISKMVKNWFHSETTYDNPIDGFVVKSKIGLRESDFSCECFLDECEEILRMFDHGVLKQLRTLDSCPIVENYTYDWSFGKIVFRGQWPTDITIEISRQTRYMCEQTLKKYRARRAVVVDVIVEDVETPTIYTTEKLLYPLKRTHPGLTSFPTMVKTSTLLVNMITKQLTEKKPKRGLVRLIED